jgi:hypothetical protein
VDLNHRPLGYEPNWNRHAHQPIPTNTKKIQENRFRVPPREGLIPAGYIQFGLGPDRTPIQFASTSSQERTAKIIGSSKSTTERFFAIFE